MSLVRFEHEAGAMLVLPSCPRLDAEVAVEFSQVVGAQARGRARVTVSLADVEVVDCSGLAALVVVLKQMAPGGELRLSGVAPGVRSLLEATGLSAVFPIAEDAADASAALEECPALAP